MSRELHGCRILITGASRGIGRCVAEQLAAFGVKLTLVARSADALAELAGKLTANGTTAFPVAADVTDPAQRERIVREAVDKMGGLDVLLNVAGVASFGHFDTSSEAVLRTIMEVNFFAPAELMRLAIPHLMKGRQPAIVNVASICGRRGLPAWTEHSASKYALVGLSEALRGEFARFDVDVLVVLPGLVKSDDLGRHLSQRRAHEDELRRGATARRSRGRRGPGAAAEPGRNAGRLAGEMAQPRQPLDAPIRGPDDGTQSAAALLLMVYVSRET